MKKICIQFGLSSNSFKIIGYVSYLNLKEPQYNSKYTFINKNLEKIFNELGISYLLDKTFSLIDLLSDIIAQYQFSWLEVTLSIVKNKTKTFLQHVYLGGILNLSGLERPVGIKQKNITNLRRNFIHLISEIMSDSINTTLIDLNKNHLKFDSFSSGILFHEIFGHLSEGDIKNIKSSFLPNMEINFNVFDIPTYPNEEDDLGIKGKNINLLQNNLSYTTGNVFAYIDKENTKNNIGIIRQRKLIAIPINPIDLITPNAIISSGKINVKKHMVYLKAYSCDRKYINLEIPLREIKEIFVSKDIPRSYSTICKKASYSKIVSFKIPNTSVKLKKKIQSYIK